MMKELQQSAVSTDITSHREQRQNLSPDAWSYTSLIATVARNPSRASGVNDPSLAFELLEDMKARKIRPNGMTYSALIDVCGRCKRADMALQGLRIMLRQKAEDQEYLRELRKKDGQNQNGGSFSIGRVFARQRLLPRRF